ncbi:MAG: sigma 54-interacting transcriptional regulator [Planctomycetota bacterium]|nr:sigma 54-interacting transcriptional regulator [Planctomycetota bacterium]
MNQLTLKTLLDAKLSEGTLHFAGQRSLILDAMALGLLRKELIETLGSSAAKGLLTRFGYSHGWRTGESLREHFDWKDPEEGRRAGGRLHALQGIVAIDPLPDKPGPYASAIWRNSYEAEQHTLHLGLSSECVCWSLTGFASGYLSYCHGRAVLCVEQSCVGRGDAICKIEGKPEEEWRKDVREAQRPLYETECLQATLQELTHALKKTDRKLSARRKKLARYGQGSNDRDGLVARNSQMIRVIELARRAARVDSSVFITGESGVGKERIARLIHDESPRAGRAFVAVNCGAISESLIESELFGHKQGAFSGATQDRIGLFEAAQGGTLFLDEIGELSQATQVKLLRVLQEREIRRVGENRQRSIDVRLITATNRELPVEIERGTFRRDLFYRIKVVEIHVPPLRDRPEDILALARTLLLNLAERIQRPMPELSPEAADCLTLYSWPGNVRELENAMERALVVGDGQRMELEDLPAEMRRGETPKDPTQTDPRTLEEIEKAAVLAAFEANDRHRGRTASQLGIGSATLYRKLKKYKLPTL